MTDKVINSLRTFLNAKSPTEQGSNFDSELQSHFTQLLHQFRSNRESFTPEHVTQLIQLANDYLPKVRLAALRLCMMAGAIVEGQSPSFATVEASKTFVDLLSQLIPYALEYEILMDSLKEERKNNSDSEEEDEDDEDEEGELMQQIIQANPAAYICAEILHNIPPPTSVFLSAHKEARDYLREKKLDELMAVPQLRWRYKLMHMICTVLDDEPILVLYPELKKGWRFNITGIADNHQLHQLLVDQLVPDHLNGNPLHPQVRSVMYGTGPVEISKTTCNQWDMYNYSIVDGEKTIQVSNSDKWIWNEGAPHDIEVFEDETTEEKFRVVILGKSSYTRSLNCCRMFGPLKASIQITSVLSSDEVESYLDKFATVAKSKEQKP
jgi:hypothetical protein